MTAPNSNEYEGLKNMDWNLERATIEPEFSVDFYLGQLSSPSDIDDPILHYLEVGWRALLDPSEDFSTSYYLESNSDVVDAGINPFFHYIASGRDEGRIPHPKYDHDMVEAREYEVSIIGEHFDEKFYARQVPELAGQNKDALSRHFVEYGWHDLLDPSPDFSTSLYLERYSDVRESAINPYFHYLVVGRSEGRESFPAQRVDEQEALYDTDLQFERETIEPEFDVEFYLKQLPPSAEISDPIRHYLTIGCNALFDPSAEFSTSFYLTTNTDVAESGINPFFHYIVHGRNEGRLPHPSEEHDTVGEQKYEVSIIKEHFDKEFYVQQVPELAGQNRRALLKHFVEHGWRALLDPAPNFSTSLYLERYSDVRESGINPYFHYLAVGQSEGRESFPSRRVGEQEDSRNMDFSFERATIEKEFDAEFYLKQLPPSAEIEDPVLHYLEVGCRASLDPSPKFSTSFYLENNSDVAESGVNPFFHYIVSGRKEGRLSREEERDGLTEALRYEISVIKDHFDKEFYLQQVPRLAGWDRDALLRHFVEHGWRTLLDPSPKFSTSQYLESYQDVREDGINPLFHYLTIGKSEGRIASTAYQPGGSEKPTNIELHFERSIIEPEFDVEFYLKQLPPSAEIDDPILHYLEIGCHASLDPSAEFSTSFYLAENQDVAENGINPLFHYIVNGRNEGRLPHPKDEDGMTEDLRYEMSLIKESFSEEYYARQVPELAGQPREVMLRHFVEHGWRERLDPSASFSTSYYLDKYSDIRKSGINPLLHYVKFGRREGRVATLAEAILTSQIEKIRNSGLFDERWYLNTYAAELEKDADPIRHYLEKGAANGMNPSPAFQTRFYIRQLNWQTQMRLNLL